MKILFLDTPEGRREMACWQLLEAFRIALKREAEIEARAKAEQDATDLAFVKRIAGER